MAFCINSQNSAIIELKTIHFIDKIKPILHPLVLHNPPDPNAYAEEVHRLLTISPQLHFYIGRFGKENLLPRVLWLHIF